MSVVVNELSTEVQVAGTRGGETSSSPPSRADVAWPEVERVRAAAARMERDRQRTRAEGFHD